MPYPPMRLCLMLLLAATVAAPAARAQEPVPTRVVVRALSHDAKLIGSNVGGAWITIQDAGTGRVLAEGLHEGNTGDTRRIMVEPRQRGVSPFATEGAAAFVATLMLAHPTMVDVTAHAPLGTPGAQTRASKRLLLLPGRDVLGEGILLELNGFTVELLAPGAPAALAAGAPLDVRAKVTMLCGCPTEPGGMWDADRYEIVARLLRGGEVVASAPLAYAGEASTFAGRLDTPAPGVYTLEVLAADPARANFGRTTQAVVVE